jgi:cellulose synthase (UDP-forming)
LHAKGYRSIYHAEPLAFGLAPESIAPFISQRIRWGQGAMHVWRQEGLLTHRGLSWAQRLNYLASVLTYFDGWQKGIFYFAPVVVLLTGTMPLIASTPDFLLHFVPYYLLTLWAFEEVGRGYGRTRFVEQYNMARFAAFAWATLAWVLPRRWLRFKVTRKGRLADSSARFVAPQALVLALNIAAIPLGIVFFVLGGVLPLDGLIANAIWAVVNAAMALAVLVFTSRTSLFVRGTYRFPVPLAAELEVPGSGTLRGTIDDISGSGFRFYGPLPAKLHVGQTLHGRISLPDEPMPFRGEVRSIFGGEDGGLRAVGCRFETDADHLHRLETFLFGSDLQWSLNSLSDRVHTPLSWLWPALVDGPRPSELAGVRWNAAALSDPRVDRESPVMALVSTPLDVRGSAVLLSFTALPLGRNLRIEVSKRRPDLPVQCQLSSMTLATPSPGVHLYRLSMAMTLPARDASAPLAQPAVVPQRSHPDYADTGL